MEYNMNTVSNLLEQTNLIKKKYDEFAEYTGENFNVFFTLNIAEKEKTHSDFIADLLNINAGHGQKDVFLKLFIEEVKELFQDKTKLENFETSKSFVITEKHTGNGYIDVFITNGKNSIIIENKIWAKDQHQQLVRYYTFDPNAPIIYLTLNEKKPTDSSKGDLKNGDNFICISYEKHIKSWLEKCIKEMVNKPIIRETLNQYLHLIKILTGQTTNNEMAQEVIDLISKYDGNLQVAKLIVDNYQEAIKKLKLDELDKLKKLLESRGLDCDIDRANRSHWSDGIFVSLKQFSLEDEVYDLGVNIELENNFFFFCMAKRNEKRDEHINEYPKFEMVKNYLHQRIPNLSTTAYTIGRFNDEKEEKIDIDKNTYYLNSVDNTEVYRTLAGKIAKLKEVLNK